MNKKIIRLVLAKILYLEAALLALPLLVGLLYGESANDLFNFLLPLLASLIGGKLVDVDSREDVGRFYYREAFFIVALVWVLISMISAIPLWLTPSNYPTYLDALFEMVSGFTTTGASVAKDVEALPQSILFWRSFSHFIGGMGVLVFTLAILPKNSPHSSLIMKAEVPGPSFGKLVPRLSDTARILYGIYIGMTIILVILLLLGGMQPFDALIHAFGTAGTGGFSNYNASIGHYQSAYIEWVLGIGMFVFGVNFNLYYYALVRSIKDLVSSEELRVYLGIVLLSTILIAINTWSLYSSGTYTIQSSFFAVTSIISTTGYVSADFGQWPLFSQIILLLLMISGACAGSTAGGFKVSRLIIAFKKIKSDIKQTIDPKRVSVLTFEGSPLEKGIEQSVGNYALLYSLIAGLSILIVSSQTPDLLSAVSTVFTAFNNIGPGLGNYGPLANFREIGSLTKCVMIFNMLLGRLEIYPMLIIFSPEVWRSSSKAKSPKLIAKN